MVLPVSSPCRAGYVIGPVTFSRPSSPVSLPGDRCPGVKQGALFPLTMKIEIKSWILALVRYGRFKLEGDKYEIVDPYNITSVPPAGRLRIEPL